MSVVEEALEALGHPPGALPEPRLLAGLFTRFQAQVPLRRAAPGLGADATLAAWLDDGAGCCGAPRVAAFAALATAAGFRLDRALARAANGRARRVLLAEGGRLLLDAGFPLPAPLALDPPAEAEATGYGTLAVRTADAGLADVVLETRGEERRLFRVGPLAPGEEGDDAAEETRDGLFRLLADRVLRWRDGLLDVSDAWSRLRLPFPAADAAGLEALFGPPVPDGLADAGPEPGSEPTLAAYHAAAVEPARLLVLLSDPVRSAGLLPDGWGVEGLAPGPEGFARTLVEEGRVLRRERVARRPDGVFVEADGPLAVFRTRSWRLEPRPAGTRIRLLATFRDPLPPRGLPEGTRRRLVFELASELLALDRLAAEG